MPLAQNTRDFLADYSEPTLPSIDGLLMLVHNVFTQMKLWPQWGMTWPEDGWTFRPIHLQLIFTQAMFELQLA